MNRTHTYNNNNKKNCGEQKIEKMNEVRHK